MAPVTVDRTAAHTAASDEADARPVRAVKEGRRWPWSDWLERRRANERMQGRFTTYPHLLALKPREKYVFRSDYYEVDGEAAVVLEFVHREGSDEALAPFWGIDCIPNPDNLDRSVVAILLEQVRRRDDKWIEAHQKTAERLEAVDAGDVAEGVTRRREMGMRKRAADMDQVATDLAGGAAYLWVHRRLLLKAPRLEVLEDAVERVQRMYVDAFAGTYNVAPYAGAQRAELRSLLRPNEKKRGKGLHLTSIEAAGSYNLVTNGLSDPGGEYVGYMISDANNSAVMPDLNGYAHHVVIADEVRNKANLGGQRMSNAWGSKLAQSCLLNGGRVVHLVLDDTDLSKLGPSFDRLTARLDLNRGEINPFEMFGDTSEQLEVYAMQIEKLKLLFEQLHDGVEGASVTITRGTLERILTDFYVQQRMWRHNAKEHVDQLRAVGIPHDQVPLMQMFSAYVATARKALVANEARDPQELEAVNILSADVRAMLTTNGSIFNNITSDAIDGVDDAQRVVYDFSRLMNRGRGVAMAQLVNVIGFAASKLGEGDTLIIHGTEVIDDRIKGYMTQQLERMAGRGGRTVYIYNSVDKMLTDHAFNDFEQADYTILGRMSPATVERYQKVMATTIPQSLQQAITAADESRQYSYFRRGVTNVVFATDLLLGLNPVWEAQRREMVRAAEIAASRERLDTLGKRETAEASQARGENVAPRGGGTARLDAARRGRLPERQERMHRGRRKELRRN